MTDICERLRGIYRIPITDGLGPAGGEEPDNANEFVRNYSTFTPPIQLEAAAHIEAQDATIKALVEAIEWLESEIKENGFPAEGPMRSRCRTALAAAKETT